MVLQFIKFTNVIISAFISKHLQWNNQVEIPNYNILHRPALKMFVRMYLSNFELHLNRNADASRRKYGFETPTREQASNSEKLYGMCNACCSEILWSVNRMVSLIITCIHTWYFQSSITSIHLIAHNFHYKAFVLQIKLPVYASKDISFSIKFIK